MPSYSLMTSRAACWSPGRGIYFEKHGKQATKLLDQVATRSCHATQFFQSHVELAIDTAEERLGSNTSPSRLIGESQNAASLTCTTSALILNSAPVNERRHTWQQRFFGRSMQVKDNARVAGRLPHASQSYLGKQQCRSNIASVVRRARCCKPRDSSANVPCMTASTASW